MTLPTSDTYVSLEHRTFPRLCPYMGRKGDMSNHDVAVSSSYTWDSALFLISLAFNDRPIIAAASSILRWWLLWVARSKLDPTKSGDLLLFIALAVWGVRHHIVWYLSQPMIFRLIVAKSITAVFIYLGLKFWTWRSHAIQHRWASAILKQDALSSPWIIPSKTTHTRVFPKQHSFAYSYLTVAVPVGFKGWCWPMMSVDVSYAKGWFHVQASDHLARGQAKLDLKDKLAEYLSSQGVQDSEWTYAYLITAPRFLGYSFNPVSFWYIYDEKRVLKKMILEVNNTFDERRMYLLDAQNPDPNNSSAKFKQTWAKDFHVSPFNSRKGFYSLTASDPFSGDGTKLRPIDNTIVMSSSKQHAKIVARLKSEGDPVNPRELTRLGMLAFLVQWWWVGFFTFPRIVKEAGKLFFQRKLHVWFRPEVSNTSIGRNASSVEKMLQPFVDDFITRTVSDAEMPITVSFKKPDGTVEKIDSASATTTKDEQAESTMLHITILTPAFYSRFVHYCSISEALNREAFLTSEKNRTLWVSDPALLAQIFVNVDKNTLTCELDPTMQRRSLLHTRLRCPPPAQAYPDATPAGHENAMHKVVDIRPSVLSALDRYILQHCEDSWLYLRCCATLFLAERLAFGLVPVIALADFTIRFGLCYWLTMPMLFRPAQLPSSSVLLDSRLLSILGDTLGLWALHLWSRLKGLPK